MFTTCVCCRAGACRQQQGAPQSHLAAWGGEGAATALLASEELLGQPGLAQPPLGQPPLGQPPLQRDGAGPLDPADEMHELLSLTFSQHTLSMLEAAMQPGGAAQQLQLQSRSAPAGQWQLGGGGAAAVSAPAQPGAPHCTGFGQAPAPGPAGVAAALPEQLLPVTFSQQTLEMIRAALAAVPEHFLQQLQCGPLPELQPAAPQPLSQQLLLQQQQQAALAPGAAAVATMAAAAAAAATAAAPAQRLLGSAGGGPPQGPGQVGTCTGELLRPMLPETLTHNTLRFLEHWQQQEQQLRQQWVVGGAAGGGGGGASVGPQASMEGLLASCLLRSMEGAVQGSGWLQAAAAPGAEQGQQGQQQLLPGGPPAAGTAGQPAALPAVSRPPDASRSGDQLAAWFASWLGR